MSVASVILVQTANNSDPADLPEKSILAGRPMWQQLPNQMLPSSAQLDDTSCFNNLWMSSHVPLARTGIFARSISAAAFLPATACPERRSTETRARDAPSDAPAVDGMYAIGEI